MCQSPGLAALWGGRGEELTGFVQERVGSGTMNVFSFLFLSYLFTLLVIYPEQTVLHDGCYSHSHFTD